MDISERDRNQWQPQDAAHEKPLSWRCHILQPFEATASRSIYCIIRLLPFSLVVKDALYNSHLEYKFYSIYRTHRTLFGFLRTFVSMALKGFVIYRGLIIISIY